MKSLLSVVLLLAMTCCVRSVSVKPPDPLQNLQTAAKALNDISLAASTAVKTVLLVMPQNTPQRQQILAVIGKIVEADNHGIAVVRALTTLDSKSSADLSFMLMPVFAEFRKAIDAGLFGTDVSGKVKPYIDTIGASILIIETILKARVSYGSGNNIRPNWACNAAWDANHPLVCA